jgi:alcohol dehydrogenase class IV
VVALVEPAIPERLHGIAGSLGSERATDGVAALGRDLGAPTSLRSLGMPEDGLDAAADFAAAAVVDDSPVPLDAEILAGLLRDAYAGRAPGAHRA